MIRPAAVSLLKIVIFFVLFIILLILVGIAASIVGKVFKLPILRQTDGLLGAVLGAVQGVVLVFAAVSVISLIASASKPDGKITRAVVNDTLIVKSVEKSIPSPTGFIQCSEQERCKPSLPSILQRERRHYMHLFNIELKMNVPNALSLFRIALLPLFACLYLNGGQNQTYSYLAFGVLILSGISDSLDGIIARKFNQITDLGKILDPLADKLTQVTVAVCLALRYRIVVYLLAICLVKEICQTIGGVILLAAA